MMSDEMSVEDYRLLYGEDAPKRRKFGNQPVEINGIKFDSKAEASHYLVLRGKQEEGAISHLRVHTKWEIIPAHDYMGKHFKHTVYVSDFDYVDLESEGMFTIVDVKSKPTRTAVFRLKWRLMQVCYPGCYLMIVES